MVPNNIFNWKKLIGIALAVFLFVGIAACNGETSTIPSSNTTVSDTSTTTATEESTTTTTTSSETTTTTEIVNLAVTQSEVKLYDGPGIMTSSDLVDIFVEGEEVFVYETLVNHGRTFTYTTPTSKVPIAIFDFQGSITVSIVVNNVAEVTSAKVTPAAYGITPTITDGDTITFTLDYPTSYTVEYNDDYHNAIHLFTNTIEDETYDPENLPEDVIYIGPGVYKADNIPVTSNQTLYIAGGAVVYGKIRTENMENITIKGRGIIDGSIYPRNQASEYTIPIELRRSNNILIDGITFLNPAGWCIAVYFSEDIMIQNVHIVTARANGDGISIQSSNDILVRDSFLRTWDDALVVKNYDLGTTNNVRFENIVIWTDLAQSMEIGYETYGVSMSNIVFEDITVLHNFHKPVMSIHNSDQAAITNVVFRNITVEDAQMIGDNATVNTDDFLIEIFIRYHQVWSKSADVRGSINGVTIENVKVLSGKPDNISLIHGYDTTHNTQNITIRDVEIYDNLVYDAEDLSLTTNEFVSNLTIENSGTVTGANLHYPYELDLEPDDVPTVTVEENIIQEGYIVPEFSQAEPVSSYMGVKVTGEFTAQTTRGTEIAVWDDGTGSYDAVTNGSDFVIDGDTQTMWESVDLDTDPTKYYALTVDFHADKSIGTIRVYGDIDSEFYQVQYISIYGIKSTSTTGSFTKILSTNDYEFSPATGNVVDMKIRSGEFKAIQFRFYYVDEPQTAKHAFLSEVEFYPASLSFGKSVEGTEHEDVYQKLYVTDGNPLTYYESIRDTWPAYLTIDLLNPYDVKYISFYLPSQWEDRTQEIEILISNDNINFTTIVVKTAYTFRTSESNVVEVILDNAVNARFVKFIFSSNSSGYGGQVSEINIFE
ncbi:MAG: discoidin domain-containing protein [Bacilli bacterium]|nr:discoidin domain-containing protein [Bacilli bacterium]MBN2696838.1 discoidin domain-containing protein [Bacilli bacterium]